MSSVIKAGDTDILRMTELSFIVSFLRKEGGNAMEEYHKESQAPSTVSSRCLNKKISGKKTFGSAADKQGKRFESELAKILRCGGKSEDEKLIAEYIYNATNTSFGDIKKVTDSPSAITRTKSKSLVKTDVIIDLQDGRFVSLSLKNTKAATVGVLETSLQSWFEHFNVQDTDIQGAFFVYRDNCRFNISQLRDHFPREYTMLMRYFDRNIDSILHGLICGFNGNDRARPQYIVFNDKKTQEIMCLSVDKFIELTVKYHKAQFGVPLVLTRASGSHGKSLSIKVKIYNPIKDCHRQVPI